MRGAALSRELRRGSGTFLRCRRALVALNLTAIAALGLTSLYQLGLIPRPPEPPLPGFDGEKVNASAEAYAFGLPDGPLGIASYTVTLLLAAAGGPDREREQPWLPLLLAAKVAFDLSQAARLTLNEVRVQRALCFWCLVTSLSSVASAPLVLPEAQAAWRCVRK